MSGAIAYEIRRIVSIRSTWILAIVAAVVPGVLTMLLLWAGGEFSGPGAEGDAGEIGASGPIMLVVAAVLCTIGAAAIGQEYRHGLIRVTLAVMPRRNEVMAAKIIVVSAFIVVAALAAVALSLVGEVIGAALGGATISPESDVVIRVLSAVVFVLLFALFAFSVTALTRSQPLGIIIPIVLAAVVEPIVVNIGALFGWTWLEWVLPFTSAVGAVGVPGAEGWAHLGVLALWIVALLTPAWLLFFRRDA